MVDRQSACKKSCANWCISSVELMWTLEVKVGLLTYGLMNRTSNIIIWAHLIQGIKLPIVSQGPIAGGTMEMQMACMGPLEHNGIIRATS